MNKLLRILKHRWLDERDSLRLVGADALQRLEQRVHASEQTHHGEIRLCVEAGLPLSYLWRGLSARDRAVMMFSKLRVWDTEANNGVLIYLLLAEHRIEIVADRGVARLVPQAEWDAIVAGLRDALRAGRHEAGLSAAIDAVDKLLLAHYAVVGQARNPNELPDRPVLR